MLGSEPKKYDVIFGKFVGANEDGELFNFSSPLLFFIAITFFANFFLIYRGITKGIEDFCKWAMPLMAICAVLVLIRVMTLPPPIPDKPEQNVLNGLGYMWNPNFAALMKGETWLAATSQIFFSLSVGFGIVINYASYLKKKDDVALSSLTAASMNEFFEVCLGGLITIPAAFLFLGAISGDQSGTFSLGFKVLPNVFAQMPAGRLFGFLWFTMLFLAAITSSVSMLQPVIAFLEEGLGLKRKTSVAMLGGLTLLGSAFVVYFSKGLSALDTLDYWIGTVLIFILAMVQSFLYGWVLGIDRGEEELHYGAHLRVPRFVQYLLKYVTPLYLLIVFAFTFLSDGAGRLSALVNPKDPVPGISFGLILVVFALLMVLIFIAGRRWQASGRLPGKELS